MQRTLKMQSRCDHEQTIPTSVAGMERLVCESCGHVSIKLVNVGITRPRHLETSPRGLLSRPGISGGRFEGGSEGGEV